MSFLSSLLKILLSPVIPIVPKTPISTTTPVSTQTVTQLVTQTVTQVLTQYEYVYLSASCPVCPISTTVPQGYTLVYYYQISNPYSQDLNDIQVPIELVVNNPLSYIFCEDQACNKPLFSWYEPSGIFWVLIPFIPANGDIVIYLYENGDVNYPYTGTFGSPLYDNGRGVFYEYFSFYDTLPHEWSTCYNAVSPNYNSTYATLPVNPPDGGIGSDYAYPVIGYWIDFYVALPSTSSSDISSSVMALGVGSCNTTNTYFIGGGGGDTCGNNANGFAFCYDNFGTTNQWGVYVGTTQVAPSPLNYTPNNFALYSIGVLSSSIIFQMNYNNQFIYSGSPPISMGNLVILDSIGTIGLGFVRMRKATPDGNNLPVLTFTPSGALAS
ncbi:signal peptide protein [Sulfolobus ellipsoid virus 1]|uniref:Signal peptide protein n=1 Tax=Sulfolobus ellipsoid virus 1 TaxID=2056194 RepID=A0A2H4RBQ2_9VIRU|nr:signal peptide protein [Sulfolobus ellipsoid virus 1]ATY46494.1 signal peptide protein [Sulfolobus ellipsoid virus 1]